MAEISTNWKKDILGTPYECRTIDLADDWEGPVRATLVRQRCAQTTAKAVLYIHGFVDYFFQQEMGEQFTSRGIDFYAIDLRKYGRSLMSHQTPNYCNDVAEYFEELTLAWNIICEEDKHNQVLLSAHSTGGLIASHFVQFAAPKPYPKAIFLNSPFLEFNDNWLTKEILLDVIGALGMRRPEAVVPGGVSSLYTESVHKDYRGSWDFNIEWKPVEGFPILAGWVRAIHNAHKILHAGFNIQAPILVMHSAQSTRTKEWTDSLLTTDGVLDVNDIRRYADCLGDHLTKIRISGGMHDLILSAKEVRDRVYDELFLWLGAYF